MRITVRLVSLITELEYGLEQWNGLWNGLMLQQTAPFHTVL